ncbi:MULTISPECIES: class I SAM-dependent methyltransferase [Cyanophyceae]|uniref:class I SAM-dependent methyltransferase n=1 Tax=Cyanophyceae TaxID=3028117 RepID=UPI00232F7E81|nr:MULTISPECIES: class I SAM-dependent methyltransferase [Cyanophyceae]MDB9356836.1 class I SAM-dependent methyltransferase [Nodularia spumigena CS-587/03]MDB9306756.1 class I SAM-dependent methyltransferase [Nodularia spumigena CS-591/12]MDB9319063.1 class I SAM-dependent methyltransferase [Nodularia spumigena CS-590/01A]MDB9324443.1 class I SAM-dependent methyltransferase [Nodularia spumigena CS-591/07A]MDB9324914.1 class I SAM-dependent methyltransferase [Nodularia spumigena CS-590/02]
MSKKRNSPDPIELFPSQTPYNSENWQERVAQVGYRFNRQYQKQDLELPAEVQEMPIYQEWVTGLLSGKIASPFWEIAQPKKNQHCLDIGCGVSFLIYPWRDWLAYFYGQEISTVARDTLNSRGPQLNSKLFKGVELGPAHQLNYSADQFDLAIATGFSCYFPLKYWSAVLAEVNRVLKPDGYFVFDILNPEHPLAEDWAVLETYLGAEVFLEPVAEWEKMIKATGAKVAAKQSGELFDLYKVKF